VVLVNIQHFVLFGRCIQVAEQFFEFPTIVIVSLPIAKIRNVAFTNFSCRILPSVGIRTFPGRQSVKIDEPERKQHAEATKPAPIERVRFRDRGMQSWKCVLYEKKRQLFTAQRRIWRASWANTNQHKSLIPAASSSNLRGDGNIREAGQNIAY
jgi:hypothetical protein